MGERQFGPYRLVQQIAVGGMAEIHLAKTHGIAGFEKYVALKMIHPNFSQDEQFILMLIDEAKITVQLQHVNVAQTFDLGRVGDTYYITMEFVDGADLYKLLRRASERNIPTPVDVCAYIAKEMATGLDYAHRKRDMTGRPLGIVHRDVSPQNVLISHAGEVKLVDFGIAKATMRVRQTAVGVIKGKYYYMSPEQAWGDPLDHRSDVFSTGIVLYEMLTGQMLYLEEDLHRLLDMVRKANIAPPSTLRRDVPPQLERIVMHALAKKREDRYQTAGDMATDLERFLHAYSPVFTAAKVNAYTQKVLAEAEPPPPAAAPVRAPAPEPRHPSQNTQRVQRDQLVRARSEFTDENSVIFRMKDLKREAAGFGEDSTGTTSPEPLARKPGGSARPAHVPTMELEDSGDDRTVISGPPGFGGEDSTDAPLGDMLDTPEPTMQLSDGDFDDENNPTRAAGPRLARRPVDEGPTNPDFSPRSRGVAPQAPPAAHGPVSDGVPKPNLGRPAGAPAHPALSASTPRPAVSALRPARESRRTPASGVPLPGSGGPESILSAIIGSAQDSVPTAPVTGGRRDGVPQVDMTGRTDVPVNRKPGQVPVPQVQQLPPMGAQGPPAMPPPPSLTQADTPMPEQVRTLISSHGPPALPLPAGPPSAPVQMPMMPGQQQQGFPLAAPAQTPNPFLPFPVPPGQPSISMQLRAIELDAVPPQFVIGRKRSLGWLLAAAALVGGLVVIAIVLLVTRESSSSSPVVSLRIDTHPAGAKIFVDGAEQPGVTPLFFKEAKRGARYVVKAELAGFEPKSKEVLVGEGDTPNDIIFLDKIRVRLVVSSKPLRANVFLDGVRVGTTPIDLKFESPPEKVEITMPGYKRFEKQLDWAGKTEETVEATLERQ
jgi:serine/threonine protein kinase